MTTGIKYLYFLCDRNHPVLPDGMMWNQSIPLSRKGNDSSFPLTVRYGEFFMAIHQFFEDIIESLATVLSHKHGKKVLPDDIHTIRIFLEKHGEFYHPCRIEVSCQENLMTQCQSFVLNCAISEIGKKFIHHEFDVLNQLSNKFHSDDIPKAYLKGTASIGNKFDMPVFIGDWFEGYHEFHLCQNGSGDFPKIHIWDPNTPTVYLNRQEAVELYRQISKILTTFYQPQTGEQICLWHHAAGDFVVRYDGALDVKLITIRHYSSMFEIDPSDHNSILGSLLLFLIDTSIRMRLDRLNGVGELVWSDDAAVEGMVLGFLQAISDCYIPPFQPTSLRDAFLTFILSFHKVNIFELAKAVLDTYPPQSPEIPIIQSKLQDHIDCLNRYLVDAVL